MNRLFSFFLLFTLCWACTSSADQADTHQKMVTNEPDIPELLDRHPALRQGTEWDQIQRFYVAQQQTLRQKPNDAEAQLKLAQVFINEARITGEHGHYYPAALISIDRGLKRNGLEKDLQFRLLSLKASVQLSQHEFPAALATAQEAVELNPYNAQIYGALVDAHVELGQYEMAVEMADKMVQIRPDLRSYSRVSYLREIHGDVEGAIEAMHLAVSAGYPGQESTSWALLTLGELYETYGQTGRAKQQYQLALDQRPNYPFAIAKLAHLDLQAGKYKEAERQLEQAIDFIPEVGFYIDLADLYQQTQRIEEFTDAQKEILAMLQDDVNSGHQMDMEYASLYLDLLNEPQKALVYAQMEYDKRPNNIDVNRLMARIHFVLGNTTAVEMHLEKASITNSQHPELLEIGQQLAIK